MIFNGNVIKKLIARGSKSEHEAVCLVTDQGEFVLRRRGEIHFPTLNWTTWWESKFDAKPKWLVTL